MMMENPNFIFTNRSESNHSKYHHQQRKTKTTTTSYRVTPKNMLQQSEPMKKSSYVMLCCLTEIVAMICSSTYYLSSHIAAAVSSFICSCLVGFSLLHCIRTDHQKQVFVSFHLFLILSLPFSVHFTLGGLQASGGIIIWAFIAPYSSSLFLRAKESMMWFQSFILLSIVSLAMEVVVTDHLTVPISPTRILELYWMINILGATSVVFVTSRVHSRNVEEEYARSEMLLHNILPSSIVHRIKEGNLPIVDDLEDVTILFADLVGFTKASAEMDPKILIGGFLRDVFSSFDRLVEKRQLEKIKTIGDAYMVVAGLEKSPIQHTQEAMNLSAEMFEELRTVNEKYGLDFKLRIGLQTGSAVAGVLGMHKIAFGKIHSNHLHSVRYLYSFSHCF